MEDAVRPNKQAFKAMYERGYRTWLSLYKMTIADTEAQSRSWDCLNQLENAFLEYPSFPENLAVDASFSNTVLVKGVSTWKTAQGHCDLPSFDREFLLQVASDCPTILEISDGQHSVLEFLRYSSEHDNHTTLLILAWTYILSARWAEIIPGASGPEYSNCQAEWREQSIPFEKHSTASATTLIDLGDIDDDAARWWAAILALEGGWNTTIKSDRGTILYSPWHTQIVSKQRFLLSRGTNSCLLSATHRAPSPVAAMRYLFNYCDFHNVTEQSHAAMAATLLLPVARFDNRRLRLPTPRVRRRARIDEKTTTNLVWGENSNHLDKLLTLSCNAVGMKALLTSVFYEPGVECNICGA